MLLILMPDLKTYFVKNIGNITSGNKQNGYEEVSEHKFVECIGINIEGIGYKKKFV